MKTFLNFIERAGNKLPHPFILFWILALITILVSWGMSHLNLGLSNPKTGAAVVVRSLVSEDGLRFMLDGVVKNFIAFPPLGVIIVVMFGIGVADRVGLIGTLMQLTVVKAPPKLVTTAIVVSAICGSVAADATYLILVPLAGMIFKSLGRNPIAGAALAYAAAGAGFNANIFLMPTDVLLSSISTEAARTIDPTAYVSPLDNYYFVAVSTLMLVIVGVVVFHKLIEPRANTLQATHDVAVELPEVGPTQIRGLKRAGVATVVFFGLVVAAVWSDTSPLRNPDGGLVPSPLLNAVVPLLFLWFLLVGIVYGRATGQIKTSGDVPKLIGEAAKDLAPVLVLFFAISQFLAYFRWTGLGEAIAVSGSGVLTESGFHGLPLVLAFVVLGALLSFFITSGSAQWALMAPVFVPMLMLVGFEPAFVQAAYRIGDSTTNILSPMSPYFALTLAFMQRYKPDMGIGSLAALMLPMSVCYFISWTALLLLWGWAGWPIGPGIYMLSGS